MGKHKRPLTYAGVGLGALGLATGTYCYFTSGSNTGTETIPPKVTKRKRGKPLKPCRNRNTKSNGWSWTLVVLIGFLVLVVCGALFYFYRTDEGFDFQPDIENGLLR